MTEPESPENPQSPTTESAASEPRRKSPWIRRTARTFLILLPLLCIGLAILYFWASSASFEDSVRRQVIVELERATGGKAEIRAFHWDLLHLRIEVDGITIHGLEADTEAPYAHIERLRLRLAVLGLFTTHFSPQILLREAEILQPQVHLIVYPDGTTNQPHPQHARTFDKPAMDTLFDAQIGQLVVQQGSLHIADAVVPLNLQARDTSVQMKWIPDPTPTPVPGTLDAVPTGTYRILISLGDLAFAQGKQHPLSSRLDLALSLFHEGGHPGGHAGEAEGIRLESLRLAALGQTLSVTGQLTDFVHPQWRAQASGQIDMQILAPYTGFLFVRSGVVTLHASASGRGSDFDTNGDLVSKEVHYQDPIVDARVAALNLRFHAGPKQLLVSAIRARLAQGGEVDGEFQYDNWLDSTPPPATQIALKRAHQGWSVPTGIVRVHLDSVSLDTILQMLANQQYQHLALGTIASGPASSRWTGLATDLEIGGQLSLSPSNNNGEVPVQGSVDATYHVETGSIQVHQLDANLPHSSVKGTGLLGVYPIDRASEMSLDFQSSDLSEFDGVLRALDLTQGNLRGSAALPVSLQGQAQFHGQLNSSWLKPRVDGHLTATNIGLEIPSSSTPAKAAAQTQPLTFFHWDSLDVDGMYTPASIVIRHGTLHRGASSLTLQGHLDAENPAYKIGDTADEFTPHSLLSVKATAQQFPLSELLPLAGETIPVHGNLSAQVDLQGQLANLSGSGSLDLDKATGYGESIDHIHATGTVNGQQLKIASLTAQQLPNHGGGQLTGTGSYDLALRNFTINARASAIDLASIQQLKRAGVSITGKIGLTAVGQGTLTDPKIQASATFSNMTVAGEPVSDLLLTANTSKSSAHYELSSHQPSGDFSAHGDTLLNAPFETQASLKFSKFDVGALLKLMHFTGITGQSDLEGTAKISGPLSNPEKIRGEASLNELALNVEGVHLASKGPVHATLVEGTARLDPLEITGEDTDLRISGSLAISGKQQLDLLANGSVNMRLAETIDPDLIASGVTNFQMEAHGPLQDPILQGKVEFQNASLALQDFPNGLSQIKGTLEFIQNRLEIRSLTAMSGGGQLSVAGYLGFQHGLYADLSATGKAIRIRYPQGISSLADATLRLQGPQNNLQLSGNVQVTRFAINSDLDIAALTSETSGIQAIVPPDAPSNHIHFDVHLTSAPQLNFQNAYAKLAGDVDLHLRGTLATPVLLGRISLTEGSTSIGGTKYELQRGDINFNNPVRIQPNIDIDATARVEDYDITLGLHGSSDKPRLTYRSEPPLPEADIIALLALGHTQDETNGYTQQQQQAGDNPMTDALLGGALNATVTNRVQRLFGTGAIKVDPNFIGSLGNSTARVTVVEQIGNNVTFTYASNVNTTTQQLIQAEIAINRHVSLLVTQDEAGIFSVVVKARRRFK